MKRISVLGSTGSIGQNTLAIAEHLEGDVDVVALAAGSDFETLSEQIRTFRPKMVALYSEEASQKLKERWPDLEVLSGMEGLVACATHSDVNFVVSAISGTRGINPTLAAIQANKTVGLANKEVLVSAGALATSLAEKHGVKLIPIDSEHSALFQCLVGEDIESVDRLILTASGGPFLRLSSQQLESVTVDQALAHPNWSMGAKITVDSSTLMNKGLEVVEAYWLFGIPIERIDVVIHPESVIHSMVEFVDQSMKMQASEPDMRIPIQYALTYPERKKGTLAPFDFSKRPTLHFEAPDRKRFPMLDLVFDSIKEGESFLPFMNAANEVLVTRFLRKEFSWREIGTKLDALLTGHKKESVSTVDAVLEIDRRARLAAQEC